jgi:hypothetical protein
MTMEEAVLLTKLGGIVRPYFRERDGLGNLGTVIARILCFWCREYHSPSEVEACMAMARPQPASNGDSTSSLSAKMPQWLSPFPEIWEFLSKPSYKDGTPRQLGKVSFGLNSGGLQMTLTDPTSSTYCSRCYQTMEDALLGFEVGLDDGSLTWKPSGPPKGRKRP